MASNLEAACQKGRLVGWFQGNEDSDRSVPRNGRFGWHFGGEGGIEFVSGTFRKVVPLTDMQTYGRREF